MEQEIEYRKHKIIISQDNYPSSPDDWGNDEVFLVYDHRDFCVKRKSFSPRDIFENGKLFQDNYHMFVVNAYIHSGISLSLGRKYLFNDRWDVSTTGYAVVKRVKGHTWTREKAREAAEDLIEEWNTYLSGDVWRYNIEGECEDECSGFYGDEGIEQAISEAKSSIDCYIRNKVKKHHEGQQSEGQHHF